MWPNPLQLIILAFLRFVLSLGFSSMSPSTTIWFALLPTFVFQHFVDSHRFFTTGYNHILHIFKETVFKALLTFLAKIHMYNVDRKVFLNSRERSRTLHRRKPGVTTRLQSVRDTSEPGDKCDANTNQCVCYIFKSRCDTHTLHMLTLLWCDAIFEMHTSTCRTSGAPADGKFWFWGKVLQVSDESTSRFAKSSMMR